ncbi:hypothetical protein IAR55_007209 [Kwoniella newhampshirensis]|uniref:Uncharacterized protein n=1 Tax=Kwoniella newhampshirensis TaxID=1651941 RepID=A0AAW0YT31_9TREE
MPRQPSREPSIQSLSITAASRSHPYASTQQPSQRLTDESHVRQASHRTRQNALRTAEETSAVATLQAMSNTQHNLSILHKVMTSHLSKYKSHLGMIALDYGSHPASTDFMSAASAIRPYILRLVNSPGSTVNLDPPAGDFHFRPSLITASSNISSSAPWSTQALSTFDLRCTDIVQNLIGKEGSQGLTDEVMGLLLAGIGISTATAGVRIDYPLRLTREGRLTRGMSLRTWDRVTGMRNAKMGFRRFLGLVFFEAEGTWAGYDYCNPGSSIGSENPARSEKGRSLIVYLRKDSAWREEYAAVICDHVRQFSASPSVSLPLQFLYVANVERVDTGLIILDIIRSILRSEVAGTSSSVQELLASDRPALDEVKIQLARMVVWQQKVFTDVLRAAGERQRWLIDAVSEIDREGRVTELETGDDDGNDDG